MSRVPALSVSNCQRSNGHDSVEMAHETQNEMREIFNLFDLDKDGSITPSELKHAMNQQGLSPSDDELKRKFQSSHNFTLMEVVKTALYCTEQLISNLFRHEN